MLTRSVLARAPPVPGEVPSGLSATVAAERARAMADEGGGDELGWSLDLVTEIFSGVELGRLDECVEDFFDVALKRGCTPAAAYAGVNSRTDG